MLSDLGIFSVNLCLSQQQKKMASVVKLYVDGLLRCTSALNYPRQASTHLSAFMGAPVADPNKPTSCSSKSDPAEAYVTFQLGNLYLLEKAAEDSDVLFIYMLGKLLCHPDGLSP